MCIRDSRLHCAHVKATLKDPREASTTLVELRGPDDSRIATVDRRARGIRQPGEGRPAVVGEGTEQCVRGESVVAVVRDVRIQRRRQDAPAHVNRRTRISGDGPTVRRLNDGVLYGDCLLHTSRCV